MPYKFNPFTRLPDYYEPPAPPSSGEANIGQNVGTGAGVYYNKSGVTLQFRKLLSSDSSLSIVEDGTEIDFGVVTSNLDHTDFLNIGTNTHSQIDTHIANYNLHSKFPNPEVVFYEEFTGDGGTTVFNLTGTVQNGSFSSGSWDASRIKTTYPSHATGSDKKATYDSTNLFTRNRVSISSITAAGVVTLDYAPRAGVTFYVWYWYELQDTDIVDDYRREDFIASMEGYSQSIGANIALDTTVFNGILSGADVDVQTALETLDDHAHTSSDITDFDTEVSNNTDVAANTSARHSHTNKTLLDTITDSGGGTQYLSDDGTYKTPPGAATTFLGLTDTPSSYSGVGGQFVRVNSTPDALEFVSLSSAAISGNHTDLSNIGTNTHSQIDTHLADSSIHFTEASISHNSLADRQGGTTDEYYHLTSTQHTDLTDSGDATIHYHASDRARANHTGVQGATTVELLEIGTATYDDIQDWSNSIQSSGVISGGVITDGGSGTIDVSAITGIIKSTDSVTGTNYFFDLGSSSGIALTDNYTNYVYIDYNSGSPQIVVSTSNIANGHTTFNLGKVFREGTSLDIIPSGLNIYDFSKRIQQHHLEEASLHFTSGAIVGETGTRNISITAGVLYAGLNRIITDAIDTSVADTFEYYYYNGAAWIKSDQTQINNTQYNNIATGLATLSNNKYGVHWVYKGSNSNTYVIYGQGDYTLAEAESAQPPSSLPSHVQDFGVLRAKIIILKSAATFLEIESVTDINFTSTSPSNHNDLSGLQGGTAGEYYHLTVTTYGYIDQDVTSGSSPTFTGTNFSSIPNGALSETYINANGTVGLSAAWDAGSFKITAETFESDVATGTAPLTIASTTLVSNLNADLLDSQQGSYYLSRANHTGTQTASTISDFDTEVSNNSSVVANTAKVGYTDELAQDSIGTILSNEFTYDDGTPSISLNYTNISHTSLQDIGTNTHAEIDTHIADSTVHFTEASIDHTAITNIGTNTHAQIDTHISDSTVHFTEASISITASQVSDFDTEVSNNSDVSDNTTHRGSTSNPHSTTLANLTDTDLTGIAQGNIIYRNATQWVVLAPGTSGQFLQTQGAAANPQWSSPAGSGDVVGPASATDNAIARFDSTTGKLLQNSGVTINDSDDLDLNGGDITSLQKVKFNSVGTATASSSAVTVPTATYSNIEVDLNDESTVTATLTTPSAPGKCTIVFTHGSSTASTVTLATEGAENIYTEGGTIDLDGSTSDRYVVGAYFNGSNWYLSASAAMSTI